MRRSGETTTLYDKQTTSGANLINTTFLDLAPATISAGMPPYSGEFVPAETFTPASVIGDWVLFVGDELRGGVGRVNGFSVTGYADAS